MQMRSSTLGRAYGAMQGFADGAAKMSSKLPVSVSELSSIAWEVMQ